MATTTKTKAKAAAKKGKAAVAVRQRPALRRPEQNDVISMDDADEIRESLEDALVTLENFAGHLRALDRKRLNGMGIKKRGFVENVYKSAEDAPQFLPSWITLPRFKSDIDIFDELSRLYAINKQIQELLWNLVMISSDFAYTDALEYYTIVREAAKRRVDAAESIFGALRPFFKKGGSINARPTEASLKREFHAMLANKRDGKIIIENTSPKLIAGQRKIIDESYKSDAKFKDTVEGEIKQ